MADAQKKITPYEVERVCEPKIDPQSFVLKDVDKTERVYNRSLIELTGVNLPSKKGIDIEQTGEVPPLQEWDLFVALKFREEWNPSGYGIGELVNTISLLPNEELTLEVKTWETSISQQDESKSIEDKNTSDIQTTQSDANELAKENAEKTNEYVEAAASYQGYGASVSVKGGYSNEVSNLQKSMAKNKRESSEKTASEYRSTRKVRLEISRESGSESKSTRKIKNINQTQTLNVNFFSILREYKIKEYRYDAALVMLGLRVSMGASGGGYHHPDDGPGTLLRLGQLVQLLSQPSMIPRLTSQSGISPVSVVREIWTGQLQYYCAQAFGIYGEDEQKDFLQTMLSYVRPFEGWMAVDGKGQHRWAYEVFPGLEKEFLEFLFVTTQSNLKGFEHGASIDEIIDPLDGLRREEVTETWSVTMPTSGIHADLSLGICSGAEDYFEVQRYFDLELKRMEIERLKLEIERLKIQNKAIAAGEPGIKVTGPKPSTSVNVDVSPGDTTTSIEVAES